MCRVIRVHRSGFYAWLKEPLSARAAENNRLLELIRSSNEDSGMVYGSPRVHRDLRELGEVCGVNRVARIMRQNGLRARIGYRKPRFRTGKPASVAPNQLEQDFSAPGPNHTWVSDITYIRTCEGFLYLAVVIDLFSRMVVGWSMKSTLESELVLDAVLMAVLRRRPEGTVIVHSDQGSQYGSDDWVRFCKANRLDPSMSRRGNCYDNAAMESFFGSLKKERVRRRIYPSRDAARADLFDYIEVFYNRTRRHSYLGHVSPMDFETASGGTC
jgi:putative transposase